MSVIQKPPFAECLSCRQPMNAIYCHSIRKECDECGGKSLADYSDQKKISEAEALAMVRENLAQARRSNREKRA